MQDLGTTEAGLSFSWKSLYSAQVVPRSPNGVLHPLALPDVKRAVYLYLWHFHDSCHWISEPHSHSWILSSLEWMIFISIMVVPRSSRSLPQRTSKLTNQPTKDEFAGRNVHGGNKVYMDIEECLREINFGFGKASILPRNLILKVILLQSGKRNIYQVTYASNQNTNKLQIKSYSKKLFRK